MILLTTILPIEGQSGQPIFLMARSLNLIVKHFLKFVRMFFHKNHPSRRRVKIITSLPYRSGDASSARTTVCPGIGVKQVSTIQKRIHHMDPAVSNVKKMLNSYHAISMFSVII